MIEQFVCPCCGRNRVMDTKNKGRIKWNYVDLKTSGILQIRDARGKISSDGSRKGRGQAPGQGFPLIESKTLAELMKDSRYFDDLAKLRAQIIRIVKDSKELGFIEASDLT